MSKPQRRAQHDQGPQIGGADAQSLMQQMIHAGATNAARRARHKDNPTS